MKKIMLLILVVAFFGCDNYLFSQEKTDYSMARVGRNIHGVLIFIRSEPINKYTYIATVNVSVRDAKVKTFERAIKKSKNRYPYFNGMIFRYDDLSRVDLVKFEGLPVTRIGFAVGDKVSFVTGRNIYYGEVVAYEDKKYAKVKYLNDYGEDKVKDIPFTLLTPIDKETYYSNINEINSDLQKHPCFPD